ncbi:MAG: DNA primase [Candidatus Omnitrophota bacterium]
MPGFIDENILNDILTRVNIVEVISEYIPLKRAGRNYKAVCPFHHEKTASFVVSLDKQIYHCFGCGAGGNVFNFLMRYDRVDFPEAVEILAKKSGVALPEERSHSHKNTEQTARIREINESALVFYGGNLHSASGSTAREYLAKRGINQETAKLFKLGFARDKWDELISALRAKNFNLALIEKAGLIIPKDGGGYYDRFRNRIIFPIFDIKSSCLGFGARVTDESLPKYINSPETPIYKKGNNLFGLNLAKDAVREADFVVIVEGYLDCIIPYQHGLRNIAASQGTALTPEQARLIKRYTHNAVMVYDGDLAGETATLRSLDIFIEEEMNVRIVALPAGYDPDTYVRKFGIENFSKLVAGASNLFDYQLEIFSRKYGSKEAESKAKVAEGALRTIKKLKNSILRDEYIKKLSEKLDLNEAFVRDVYNKLKVESSIVNVVVESFNAVSKTNPTEKLLMKLMLEENELIGEIKKKIEPADFQDKMISRIVSTMFELVGQGKNCSTHNLINYLGEENLSCIVCESTFTPEVSSLEKEKVVNDCITRLKKNSLQIKRKKMQESIRIAEEKGNEEELNKLKLEFNCLIKQG